MKEKVVRTRHIESWSNAHAELIQRLGSNEYVPVAYLPVQPTDQVMQIPASEYVLRLAVSHRSLTETQSKLRELLQAESDPMSREHFIANECSLEFKIGVQMHLYFLELSKEQQTAWNGVPMFTLREQHTVVITAETTEAYKKLLARRPFTSEDLQEFFRRLIRSPLATAADLPDLSPQKL